MLEFMRDRGAWRRDPAVQKEVPRPLFGPLQRARRPVSQAMYRSERRASSCKAVSRACSAASAVRRLAAFQVENSTPGGTMHTRAFWHRRRGHPRQAWENSAL